MFMKVVANVLEMKLSSTDIASVSTVVKADIAAYDSSASRPKETLDKRTKSSFCTLQ